MRKPEKMTASELLAIAKAEKPDIRYTTNKRRDAIAAWWENRWCMVAGMLIDGTWAQMGDLLINGEPVNRQEDWEVAQ